MGNGVPPSGRAAPGSSGRRGHQAVWVQEACEAGETRYAIPMPGWIGPWEIAILLLIVLLVFGPKRLPELGKSLGRGMREFKNSIKGGQDEADEPAELPVKSETDEKVSTPSDRST